MDEVTRQVQMKPAVAEGPCLKAVGVRNCDHDHATAAQEPGRGADRLAGFRKVLERVPEDDRGPLSLDLLERVIAQVWTLRVALEADRLSTPAPQGVDQDAVAGAHVQHPPRWGDPVEATRE